MSVSNVIQTGSVATSAVKAPEASRTTQSAASGNALPDVAQVRTPPKSQTDSGLASSQTATTPKPNPEELQHLVEQANAALQGRFSDLKFTVAEDTDINVVRVEDSETGELIRQFPSEAMIAVARAVDEAQRGMMLEEKA